MKIYTKKGDAGETGLYGGQRVPKSHPRVNAYGTVDELNAFLGLFLAEDGLPAEVQSRFQRIQNELFQLGSELATPPGQTVSMQLLGSNEITALEHEIDSMESTLPTLTCFILPGGTRSAAILHVARTVSRRAERELVALDRLEPLRPIVLQYVNRLSDYLFVSSRFINHEIGVADIPWKHT